jgi:exonuclease III
MTIKIATWNLCLGLTNKKDIVYEELKQKEIDICLLQEVEIKKDYDKELLSSRHYKIEVENNDIKARSAIIIKDNIEYKRRQDLEEINMGIVVIDLLGPNNYYIVNIYRSFNPANGMTPLQFFESQLAIIRKVVITAKKKKVVISGDFNLDDSKRHALDYRYKIFFERLNTLCEEINLLQLIEQPTWKRIINNSVKTSTLDHLYVKNPDHVTNIEMYEPLFGDHKLITFDIMARHTVHNTVLRRNWSQYSKEKLIYALSLEPFNIETDSVQHTWNLFETALINITESLAPIEVVNSKIKPSKNNTSPHIKRKIQLRRKLLNKANTNPTNANRDRIKQLNIEIKKHISQLKSNSIRKNIIPGNSKSLWDAVKKAKDINTPKLPSKMNVQNIEILNPELPDAFADFFEAKVNNIVNEQLITDSVHNGHRKLWTTDHHFMSIENIVEAVLSMKNKPCEGHDRIPQRILKDGIEWLKYPLSFIFDQIYKTKKLPEQWLIAKITPIFKKGNPHQIENYRPISNLCSCSKIFEKLILLRIRKLEMIKKLDLTGKPQHGFKAKHSTTTACMTLQSLIARALDGDEYALMATLDLSSAFDVVNVELLLKRLTIMGLPSDMILLISEWLRTRFFYVSLDVGNSSVRHCGVGTVQGSILGPILYALFVSPLFDLAKMTLFADDNYILKSGKQIPELINQLKLTIESIIKWLKESGLKVNDDKTEICLFYRKDTPPIKIEINGNEISSSQSMNVLGITFDSKLNWQIQAQNAVTKSAKSLQAIKIIKNHFTKDELMRLIIANYYSILFYNADIWLIPSLARQTKNMLMSASASPLKICYRMYDRSISFERLHNLMNRSTPNTIMKLTHALILHKIYNTEIPNHNWLDLFFNQNFNNRNQNANFIDTSRFKQGKNLLINRFTCINNLIPYNVLNLKYGAFKIWCKNKFK